jgi:hypothetical protein
MNLFTFQRHTRTVLHSIALSASLIAAGCGGGGSGAAGPVPDPALVPAPVTEPAPVPLPVAPAAGSGECNLNTALLTIGNNFETVLATSGTPEGLFSIRFNVVGDGTFEGNVAVATASTLIFIEGGPMGPSSTTSSSFERIEGSEIVSFGSRSSSTIGMLTSELVRVYTPALRRPVTWTAGQSVTRNYRATTTFSGPPAASLPPATTVNTTGSLRFVGRESITVRAGTFDACKFEETENGVTVTTWVAATGRYAGLLLRANSPTGADFTQATALLFNGS